MVSNGAVIRKKVTSVYLIAEAACPGGLKQCLKDRNAFLSRPLFKLKK